MIGCLVYLMTFMDIIYRIIDGLNGLFHKPAFALARALPRPWPPPGAFGYIPAGALSPDLCFSGFSDTLSDTPAPSLSFPGGACIQLDTQAFFCGLPGGGRIPAFSAGLQDLYSALLHT